MPVITTVHLPPPHATSTFVINSPWSHLQNIVQHLADSGRILLKALGLRAMQTLWVAEQTPRHTQGPYVKQKPHRPLRSNAVRSLRSS